MSIPVLSLAAWSGTGKTTFLEKLIPALKRRGLRVAVLKHDGHQFDMDREGKDTWRMTQAGADVTAIFSDSRAAILENRPLTAADMVARIRDVDLILLEGMKTGPWPKLALYRADSGKPLPLPAADCLAVVSDRPVAGATHTYNLEDAEGVAAFILAWLASGAGGAAPAQ